MPIDIRALRREDAEGEMRALVALLQTTVADGASIGFHPPVDDQVAGEYWQGVLAGLSRGDRVLLAAYDHRTLVGVVQLALEPRENGRHRAELQKLMVHPSARGRGIGTSLMRAADDAARGAGRSFLVLDTREGDAAERLYRTLGWSFAGRVPGYVLEKDGSRTATLIFYRSLEPAS